MKTIKKYLVIVALIFASSSMSANVKTDELVQKMSNSEEMGKFIINKIKLTCANSFIKGLNEQSNKVLFDKMLAVQEENVTLLKVINIQFPELKNLTEVERLEVLNRFADDSPAVSVYWDCIKAKIRTLGISLGISTTFSWALNLFKGCIFSAAVADASLGLGTAGVAIETAAAAILPEIVTCSWIAGGTVIVTQAIASAFVSGLFSC